MAHDIAEQAAIRNISLQNERSRLILRIAAAPLYEIVKNLFYYDFGNLFSNIKTMKNVLLGISFCFLFVGCTQPTNRSNEIARQPEPKDIEDVSNWKINDNLKSQFKPRVVGDDTIDETSNWQNYNNDIIGFEFKYPQNWYIREETTPRTKRVYIQNAEYKDYVIGSYPENYAMMWISYWEPSPHIESYDQLIESLSKFSCTKTAIIKDPIRIYTCEFDYDPSREGYFGPSFTAYWQYNGIIYSADTADMIGGTNNEALGLQQNKIEVEILKKVLSTFNAIK